MGIKKLFNPIIFQGEWRTKNYFEGWYFKLVDATGEYSIALIPGVSLGKNKDDLHTFIQIFDNSTQKNDYLKYEIKDFIFSSGNFNVKIGDNVFSEHGITLKNDIVKGRVNFRNVSRWPKSFLGRNAMGIFGLIPFLQCYHGIFSMDHTLAGTLNINGKDIDFTGGKGYIEKDWGKRFPDSWVWMQCNHFEKAKTSLSLSIARVPLLFSKFTGFIGAFLLDGKHYTFATYNGTKIVKFEIKGDFVEVSLARKNLLLEITLEKIGGVVLASPDGKNMGGKVNESLTSKVYVKFYKNSKLLFAGQGTNCGAEIEGDLSQLI